MREAPQRDACLVGGPLRVDVDPLGRARLDELDRALGQRRAGRDCVHADPVRTELERHRLRQAPDRMLRGAVMGEPGAARVDRVDRRDVDDRPAAALVAHPRRGRADAEERAADVDADDAVELRRASGARAGSSRRRRRCSRARRGGRSARHGRRPRAASTSSSTDTSPSRSPRIVPPPARRSRAAVESVGPAVGEHDRGPRLGEPARAREAEALRRAGHESDLAAQVDERGERRSSPAGGRRSHGS